MIIKDKLIILYGNNNIGHLNTLTPSGKQNFDVINIMYLGHVPHTQVDDEGPNASRMESIQYTSVPIICLKNRSYSHKKYIHI